MGCQLCLPHRRRGYVHDLRPKSCDTRKMEEDAIDVGNAKFGGQEALVVLDHVFIPNEYIFLNGEMSSPV